MTFSEVSTTDIYVASPPPITQISILYIELSKTVVGFGYPVYIDVLVENGGQTEQTFNVTIYYNSASFRTETLALVAGENATINFEWMPSTTDAGEYTIWASISDGDLPFYDCQFGPNLFVSLLGDINGDAKVDIRDVALCAGAFGSFPDHLRWNENADINSDWKVDIQDLSRTSANYGKFWRIPVNTIAISASSPHVADGEDASTVTVTIEDEFGSPVLGANPVVFIFAGRDWGRAYAVEEIGMGTYTTQIVSICSGNFEVVAADHFGNINETLITFTHGPAVLLHLTATYDPSGNESKANLEAYAVDAYSNIVENANITFATDLGTITSIHESIPGFYKATLKPDDWGTANVTATEINSGLSVLRQVEFTGAYLEALNYPALYGNFTVAVYAYAPAKYGYLDSYGIDIFFNSTATYLLEVTDGDSADGFPAPNVTIIDEGIIRISQENELETATENMWVANLTFKSTLPDPFTVGIMPPEVYLKTILDGIPYTWFLWAPKPVRIKTGVVLEIPLKWWRLVNDDGDPLRPQDSNEAIQKRVRKAQEGFDKAFDDCRISFIIKLTWEINPISPDQKRLFDDCNNILLQNERNRLFRHFNRNKTYAWVNVYIGFGVNYPDHRPVIGLSTTGGVGGGRLGGGVFIDGTRDFDDLTLWHELVHYLSNNQIKDSGTDVGNRQGANEPGNVMNNRNMGLDMSKEQGLELDRKLAMCDP